MDSIAQEIIREFEDLQGSRGTLDSHCVEIAERVIPAHRDFFASKGQNTTLGAKQTEKVFDSTASIALSRFAAIVDSLITPRSSIWHQLVTDNDQLQKDRSVQEYFENATRILFKYRYAPKANFSAQNQLNYVSLGAYGTGSVFTDPLWGERGIRYKNTHLAETYFAENHQGLVDKCYRKFQMTCRQANQKFGDKLPGQIKNCKNPEQNFFFIHCVKPRTDKQYGRVDYKGMDFASYYVAIDGAALLDEGGYNEFPYAISRYMQMPGEVYGRSPAMEVLPSIKTLNAQKLSVLKQGQRTVDPVLLAADDGVMGDFDLRPGAVNYGGVSADGRPLVHALQVGNIAIGKELMDDERVQINDAFLITLFQILVETKTMSATEVMERMREKGILLSPTIGRIQAEYLGPLIARELDVLAQQRLLPPMPGILREAKGEYTIIYDSPLNRTQRAEEAAGLMRSVETAVSVFNVTQDPTVLDFYNWDVIIPEVSRIQGVPVQWMKDPKVVAAMRVQRAKEKQVQTMIQAAPGAAAMTKAVNEVQQTKKAS